MRVTPFFILTTKASTVHVLKSLISRSWTSALFYKLFIQAMEPNLYFAETKAQIKNVM